VTSAGEAGSDSARALLLRAADEVTRCRQIVARIETTLAPMIESGSIDRTTPQAIDLLDQMLADLVTCVAGLARHLPEETEIAAGPVLALLRLDDLRRRLAGEKIPPKQPVEGVSLFPS
jgi:hypothetical protein